MPDAPQYAIPWAVSTVFRDEASGSLHQRLDLVISFNEGHATATSVSWYYKAGGTYPLFTVMAAPVSEEMCRHAITVYDEIATLKKAEADKVVVGGFRVLQGVDQNGLQPMPPPRDPLPSPLVGPSPLDPPEGAA